MHWLLNYNTKQQQCDREPIWQKIESFSRKIWSILFLEFTKFILIFNRVGFIILLKTHRKWRDLVEYFSKIYTFVILWHLWKKLRDVEVEENHWKSCSASGTTARLRVKETVFAVKNTPNFRGASRRFGRVFLFVPNIWSRFW